MVAALGGPADLMEKPGKYLKAAKLRRELVAPAEKAELAGELAFDTRELGLAVVELGGGRTRPQDEIDLTVGLSAIAGRDWDGQAPLCVIHARDEESADRAAARILAAMRKTGKEKPAVLEKIG
jgi:thymidine phosphorylase